MQFPIDRQSLGTASDGERRFESIAAAIERSVTDGRLAAGSRLPTVRALAEHLGVSGATVAAAYELLARRGIARGEVGRGTFVAADRTIGARHTSAARGSVPAPGWRRRTLSGSPARLRAAHPRALDCASGHPDPDLLPTDILRRRWQQAAAEIEPARLQYAGPEPLGALAAVVAGRLRREGVPAADSDIVVASSALQLAAMALRALVRDGGGAITVAVEEPGYPAMIDLCERTGCRPVGVAVDSHGMLPDALAGALDAGASVVLFTPRAHNPTGASWDDDRCDALRDVLAAHERIVAIEDDHAHGIVGETPASLLGDPRLEGRVVHLGSYSKAIAPDLRIATAVCPASLRPAMLEDWSFAAGWTPRMIQRVLTLVLRDGALDGALHRARDAYASRRAAAVGALEDGGLTAAAGRVWPAADGLNVWVELPPGSDQGEVLERAASRGVVAAPGEPFRVRAGNRGAVRLSIGLVDDDGAARAGSLLADAVLAGRHAAHAAPVV